jgi:L-alanine-DL-glutamate epimerase-like enolase superfamily enzyme
MKATAVLEQWRYKVPFRIARGAFDEQHLLLCRYEGAGIVAQAEAEAAESDAAEAREQTDIAAALLQDGLPTAEVVAALPAGPVRNALDCLLWDIEAKRRGVRAWQLAGLEIDNETRVETVMTVTISAPDTMAAAAAALKGASMLKVKLGSGDIAVDIDCAHAVAAAAPGSALLIDPNEGWSFADLRRFIDATRPLDIALFEQPLARTADAALTEFRAPAPICADEACTTRASLPPLLGRYQAINIKLDKTGGLTEALLLQAEARMLGLGVMTGCNGGTSLAIAPAFLIAAGSDYVDIDGPLHLMEDRPHGMRFQGLSVSPPVAELWG